jgi:hypothetical protein
MMHVSEFLVASTIGLVRLYQGLSASEVFFASFHHENLDGDLLDFRYLGPYCVLASRFECVSSSPLLRLQGTDK